MLASPDRTQRGFIHVVDGLDGLLDHRVAGLDDIAHAVAALDRLGEDVHLARLGIDKLAPQVRVRLRVGAFITRVRLVVVFIDEDGGTDHHLSRRGIQPESTLINRFLPDAASRNPGRVCGFPGFSFICLLENKLDKLADIHQGRMQRAVPRPSVFSVAPGFVICIIPRIGNAVRTVPCGWICFIDREFHPAVIQQRAVRVMRVVKRIIYPIYCFLPLLRAAAHLGSEGRLHIPGELLRRSFRIIGERDGVILVVAVGVDNLIVRQQEIAFLTGLILLVTDHLGIDAAGVRKGNFVGIVTAPECVVVIIIPAL